MDEDYKLLIDEKFTNTHSKIDNVHTKIDTNQIILIEKLDVAIKISSEALSRVKDLEEQTSVWRWFQRKPSRFALMAATVVGIVIFSIYKISPTTSTESLSKLFSIVKLFKLLG